MHMGERFLTFDEILNKFKCKIPFTLYFGIIQAIPKIYKNDILSTKNIPSQLVDKLLYVEEVPKYVYNDMIKTNAPFLPKLYRNSKIYSKPTCLRNIIQKLSNNFISVQYLPN